MKNDHLQCYTTEANGSRLTVHPYPLIRTNERYDLGKMCSVLSAAFAKVSSQIKLNHSVDVIIYESQFVIPELGLGANADNIDAVTIRIHPKADMAALLNDRLAPLFAHELHHAGRQLKVPFKMDISLKEAMISEGLAQNFQEEIYPGSFLFVNRDLSEADWQGWEKEARTLFDKTDFDYNAWFYGDNKMPRWVGYTLGYRLVKKYLSDNKQTAADEVWADPAQMKI